MENTQASFRLWKDDFPTQISPQMKSPPPPRFLKSHPNITPGGFIFGGRAHTHETVGNVTPRLVVGRRGGGYKTGVTRGLVGRGDPGRLDRDATSPGQAAALWWGRWQRAATETCQTARQAPPRPALTLVRCWTVDSVFFFLHRLSNTLPPQIQIPQFHQWAAFQDPWGILM